MQTPRRVITRIDSEGHSSLVSDGPAPVQFAPGGTGEVEVAELWASRAPIELPAGEDDPTLARPAFLPAPGESRFRLVSIAPTEQFHLQEALHRADLIEYLVVLSGEIHLVLADGSDLLLAAGDCVIQQGTEHAWRNRSEAACIIAVILLGASPSTG